MIRIVTDAPIAVESYDHIVPKGTMRDFTKNGAYIRELIRHVGPDIKYLDLGCAGGGFVVQMLNAGGFAVGIDGSDYCLARKQFGWGEYPDNFFTADLTKPFKFENEDGSQFQFDVLSAFDVLEHIHEADLPQLCANIHNNLKPNGRFIASIATFEDENYHVTLKEKPWWLELFSKHGFVEVGGLENWGRTSSFEIAWKKV